MRSPGRRDPEGEALADSVGVALLVVLDIEGNLTALDPDAVVRIDGAARLATAAADAAGTMRGVQGRLDVGETVRGALARAAIRTARAHQWIGRIDPRAGGKLCRALTFTFTNAKVAQVEVIGDPVRLRQLDIAVL